MSYEGDSGLRSIVSEHESLLLLANAIALLLLPLGLIEGFAIIGEIIEFITVSISNLTGFAVGYGPSLGGYTALSPLILIYGIVVIGFNLLLGYTGLLSFGHAAFFGTGAYVAGISSSMVGDPDGGRRGHRSHDYRVADRVRLDPAQRRLLCGAHPDVRPDAVLLRAGARIVAHER
jgi:hypothetical protein